MSDAARNHADARLSWAGDAPKPAADPVRFFPHELDRTAFILYFLGGVVPLVALGVVIERYQVTSMSDVFSLVVLLGSFLSIGMLSLCCFLLLRRTMSRALRRVAESNERLSNLLTISQNLSTAHHENDASVTVVHAAVGLTNARAACVFLRGKQDGEFQLSASVGASGEGLKESLIEPLHELVELVTIEGRPAILQPKAKTDGRVAPAIATAAIIPLGGEEACCGALAVIHVDEDRSFSTTEINALSALAGLASVATNNAELRSLQRNFFTHVTDILVSAIDVHLGYHKGHGHRVALLANRLGHRLELGEAQLERLHFGALLHDIGMLKVDRTTAHDAVACRKHPTHGYRMLSGIRLWDEVAPLVRHHHERFDGTGYPDGLAGEEIPLEARIIALCEAFDSMTSSTSYKEPVSFDAAASEIRAGSGTQFDPVVAKAFLEILEQGMIDPA